MLHGIEEQDGETTDENVINTVNSELGIDYFSLINIGGSHRVGPRPNARSTRNNRVEPRPIIFRWNEFRTRRTIFKSKRNLKGKGTSITEKVRVVKDYPG